MSGYWRDYILYYSLKLLKSEPNHTTPATPPRRPELLQVGVSRVGNLRGWIWLLISLGFGYLSCTTSKFSPPRLLFQPQLRWPVLCRLPWTSQVHLQSTLPWDTQYLCFFFSGLLTLGPGNLLDMYVQLGSVESTGGWLHWPMGDEKSWVLVFTQGGQLRGILHCVPQQVQWSWASVSRVMVSWGMYLCIFFPPSPSPPPCFLVPAL